MGLFFKQDINEGCKIGVWELTDDYESLYSRIYPNLDDEELRKLRSYVSLRRRIEWIAPRLLLSELMESYIKISYNNTGKPYIDHKYKINIASSNDFIGIILSNKEFVGIEIELMSEKIAQVALKILNPSSVEDIDFNEKYYKLYLNWCAKETLSKVHGHYDSKYKESIQIAPYDYDKSGQIFGEISEESGTKEFIINYQVFSSQKYKDNNYLMVYCCY